MKKQEYNSNIDNFEVISLINDDNDSQSSNNNADSKCIDSNRREALTDSDDDAILKKHELLLTSSKSSKENKNNNNNNNDDNDNDNENDWLSPRNKNEVNKQSKRKRRSITCANNNSDNDNDMHDSDSDFEQPKQKSTTKTYEQRKNEKRNTSSSSSSSLSSKFFTSSYSALPMENKQKKSPPKTYEFHDFIGLSNNSFEINFYANLTNIPTYKKASKNDISIYNQICASNDCFKFDTVFMGKRKFKSYVNVEVDYLNKKFVINLNHAPDDLNCIYIENSIAIDDIENEVYTRECIPFYAIDEMKMATIDDEDLGIILIKVNEGTPFKTVVCGIGRCLNPNAEDEYSPAKYIMFSGSKEIAFLFSQRLHNNCNDFRLKQIPKNHKKFLNHLKDLVQSDTTEEDEYIEEEALRELRQHSKSCKRQERGTFKYEKEKKIDREDEKIYLVYPIQEDAVDAVSIYNGCLKKLNEPEYLNDNLIDWKIKFDINKKAIEDDSILYKIHAFNTLFFTKLTEVKDHQRGFELVKKWTQHVDIFEKDFVFVPVNKDLHWSLIVFTRLNLLKPHGKEDEKEKVTDIDGPEFLQDTDDDNKPVSCILHMDSLSPYGHNGEAFAKTLRLYLQHEWEAKKGSKLAFTSDNLPFHKCSGPTQDNSYDCGVFVIKYVEYILDHINHINPTKKSLKNKRFSKDDNVINDTAFSQECVTIERTKMRSCLEIIHKDWILEMEKIRRQKLEKGEVEDDSYLEIQTQPTIQEKVDTEKALELSEEEQLRKAINASLIDSQTTDMNTEESQVNDNNSFDDAPASDEITILRRKKPIKDVFNSS